MGEEGKAEGRPENVFLLQGKVGEEFSEGEAEDEAGSYGRQGRGRIGSSVCKVLLNLR